MISWFQSLPFKFNLHRYATVRSAAASKNEADAAKVLAADAKKEVTRSKTAAMKAVKAGGCTGRIQLTHVLKAPVFNP